MLAFTPEEHSRISKSLRKKLHPEFLSSRVGYNNTRFTYIEGWQVIDLANRIFGFNGWSSEIKNIETQTLEINKKPTIIVTCQSRITLKDGSYREDLGFGSGEGVKIALAMEKAKKEAATDAFKRALRQFGSVLGNCCYDKEFLKRVGKNEISRDMIRKNDRSINEDSFDLD